MDSQSFSTKEMQDFTRRLFETVDTDLVKLYEEQRMSKGDSWAEIDMDFLRGKAVEEYLEIGYRLIATQKMPDGSGLLFPARSPLTKEEERKEVLDLLLVLKMIAKRLEP